jgi:Glycosyl transferase family 11
MITFSRMGEYGQLGNQLFQYAMLRAVATRRGYEVALPNRFKGVKKFDQVELGLLSLRDYRVLSLRDRIVTRFYERTHAFDPAVFEQPDGTDYAGYFQTERYFAEIADRIREEFTFRPEIEDYARQYVAGFYEEGYDKVIGVHVRRGDCLNNPHLFHVHTVDYYQRGMAHFYGKHLTDPKMCFLFVSDDIPWCEENFKGPVNHRFCGTPSYLHDFAVLTYCDGHVCSGSTFSWWGAWLAAPPGQQLVVVPTPFFGEAFKFDLSDIVPKSWKEIPI